MKIIKLFILISVLFSCKKENNTGFLTFELNNSNISVSQNTKALTQAEINSFKITVPQTTISSTPYGEVKDTSYLLKIGDYLAYAENISPSNSLTDNNGYGAIRYYGEKEFTILPLETKQVSINCSVNNSKVSILLSPNFISTFDINSTIITVAQSQDMVNRALIFTNYSILEDSDNCAVAMVDATKTNSLYAFYNANQDLYFSISTKKIGASEVVTYNITSKITTSLASWHKIKFDADLNSTSGGILLTIGETSTPVNNGFSIDNYTDGDVNEDL